MEVSTFYYFWDFSSLFSSDSEADIDVTTTESPNKNKVLKKRLPKPKYHVTSFQGPASASAARPRFSSSEGEDDEYVTSGGDLASSDLDTDFSADEMSKSAVKRPSKPTMKAAAFAETENILSKATSASRDVVDPFSDPDEPDIGGYDDPPPASPFKLKIKLPQQQQQKKAPTVHVKPPKPTLPKLNLKLNINTAGLSSKKPPKKKAQKRKKSSTGSQYLDKLEEKGKVSFAASEMSKKMRESLALNRASSSSDSDSSDYDSDHMTGQSFGL